MKNSKVLKFKTKKKFFKISILSLFLIITLILVYSFSPLVFAWTNPTEPPSGGNVDLGECSNHLDFVCDCYPEDLPVGWHECSKKEIGEDCGGGRVAYLDGTGGGFIVHSTDNNGGNTIQWGCRGNSVGATLEELGTGLANTNTIIAYHNSISYYGCTSGAGGTCVAKGCNALNDGTVAAKVCKDLNSGGYTDWYLPSEFELNELYVQRELIGGFAFTMYWSSSQYFRYQPENYAWNKAFYVSGRNAGPKTQTYGVRCIRAF